MNLEETSKVKSRRVGAEHLPWCVLDVIISSNAVFKQSFSEISRSQIRPNPDRILVTDEKKKKKSISDLL